LGREAKEPKRNDDRQIEKMQRRRRRWECARFGFGVCFDSLLFVYLAKGIVFVVV
jgi:hypothetical protein